MADIADVRDHVEDISAALAQWSEWDDTKPQPDLRRAASDAVRAIDDALAGLQRIRTQLVGEIRRSDDAAAKRVDALLAARKAAG